jgi:hypothetical protein
LKNWHAPAVDEMKALPLRVLMAICAIAFPASAQTPGFNVSIEVTVADGSRPTIGGTTNLPDGTLLHILLRRPWLPDGAERLASGRTACGYDRCVLAASGNGMSDEVEVRNGQFIDGPFTDRGAPLAPGIYDLDVSLDFANTQSAEVKAQIGELGEKMGGPLINACCFNDHLSQSEVQVRLEKIRKDALTGGASVYYGRHVEIR